MKQKKRKPVTWADVHSQSGNVLAGCQHVLTGITALDTIANTTEKKASIHNLMKRLNQCCQRHALLRINALPTAKMLVGEADMMRYYNTYSELCSIMTEVEDLGNELSKLIS